MFYEYNDKYGYGNPYIYIHPLRQRQVRHLVENKPPGTRYILVFGSVLHPYCREDSDVDVALVGKIPKGENFKAMMLPNCEYDIFVYESLEDLREKSQRNPQNMERSILEGGLAVYAGE